MVGKCFNLEKMNKKINKAFTKRTSQERLVNEKKYNLKSKQRFMNEDLVMTSSF